MLALFPYLPQIIISITGCVAFNDLWPWPIFSRSFGLDLENRVRSVASTVLDGFFPYLPQMITSIRGCVACNAFDLDLYLQSQFCSIKLVKCNILSCYLLCYLSCYLFGLGIQYDLIVIMRRRDGGRGGAGGNCSSLKAWVTSRWRSCRKFKIMCILKLLQWKQCAMCQLTQQMCIECHWLQSWNQDGVR